MDWRPWLFILYVTVFFAVCIPASVLAYGFLKTKTEDRDSKALALRLAVLSGAIAYCFFSELIATGFGFKVKPVYTLGFTIARWQGIIVLAFAIGWLLAFRIRQE